MNEFRPQLVPGRIVVHGNQVIFESSRPTDQVIFPIDMADFLVLCNGTLTLTEILEKLHFERGTVPFKRIAQVLVEVKRRGLLVNGDKLEIPESVVNMTPRSSFYFKPFLQIFLGRQITNDRTYPLPFFLLSLLVIAGSFAVLSSLPQVLQPEQFLRHRGSYLQGAGVLLLMVSLLMSGKSIIKYCLLLFGTGRVYNLRLQFNGIALYLNVGNEAQFLISDRFRLTLYQLATSLSYFFLSYLIIVIIGQQAWLPQALWASVLLTFVDLDPFRQSDLSRYFRSFMDEDSLQQVSVLLRNNSLLDVLGSRPSRIYGKIPAIYLSASFAWSALLIFTLLTLLEATNPYTIYSLQEANWREAIPAVSVFLMLVAGSLIGVGYFFKLVISQLLPRLTAPRREDLDSEDPVACVIDFFSETPFFRDLPPHLIQMIVGNSNLLSFEPGEKVLFQGSRPDGFYMIVRGSAEVLVNSQFVKLLRAGGFFGEISLLTNSLRTATVQAREKCLVLKMDNKIFWRLILTNMELALFFEAIAEGRLVEGVQTVQSSGNIDRAA